MKIVYTPSVPSMIHKSLAGDFGRGASLSPRKAAAFYGCEGRRRGVPIGIDNPNFSVINRSSVHGTWCTKSLRASDVIGIYWPENWDALSPPELHVPSFLIFLPPASFLRHSSPLNHHSTSTHLSHPPLSPLAFSFSCGVPRCSVCLNLSVSSAASGTCIYRVFDENVKCHSITDSLEKSLENQLLFSELVIIRLFNEKLKSQYTQYFSIILNFILRKI